MPIQALLASPESKTLEFKERMPNPEAIAKTACAFANGGWRTILIGVADKDKTITGIDEQEIHVLEEKIANVMYTMVEPAPAFHITIHNLEGKLILKIDVFPGSLKPYHLKNKGELEGTYIRVGSTNRKADIETIEELRRQRMNISFDETSIIDASIDDIDVRNIEIYLKKREEVRDIPRVEPDMELLKKIKAARQQNGSIHPTVAGILLFSSEPDKYIPGATIKCARFKGTEMDEFIDQKIIKGWGTGIRRIRKQIEEKGLVPPEFRENNGFFKTIIYNKPEQFEFDIDEKEILAYIQKHRKASTKEMEKGLNKSKATIKRKIRTLTEKGFIVWKGKSKKDPYGYYELTGSMRIKL